MCNHEDFPCCGCDDTMTAEQYFDMMEEASDHFDACGDEPDESMDGDFDSAMESAGFGFDEQYDHYDGE